MSEVIAHPPRASLITSSAVRSTLLASSILGLRQAGHFDRYHALLDPAVRETVLFTPAGSWLPLEVGLRHYEACDRLGLSTDDILGMGNAVSRMAQQSLSSFFLTAVRGSGATPWTGLGMTPRLWERLYKGGGIYVEKAGLKDAELEIAAQPLAQIAYWRTGLRGILQSLLEPLARRVFIREGRHDEASCVYRIAWA